MLGYSGLRGLREILEGDGMKHDGCNARLRPDLLLHKIGRVALLHRWGSGSRNIQCCAHGLQSVGLIGPYIRQHPGRVCARKRVQINTRPAGDCQRNGRRVRTFPKRGDGERGLQVSGAHAAQMQRITIGKQIQPGACTQLEQRQRQAGFRCHQQHSRRQGTGAANFVCLWRAVQPVGIFGRMQHRLHCGPKLVGIGHRCGRIHACKRRCGPGKHGGVQPACHPQHKRVSRRLARPAIQPKAKGARGRYPFAKQATHQRGEGRAKRLTKSGLLLRMKAKGTGRM